MKAIAIVPGTAGSHLVDRPEPSITAQDEVKVRIIRVGIWTGKRFPAAALRPRMVRRNWSSVTKCSVKWWESARPLLA